MRTRIKICGITRLEDVKAAAQSGVDAIGFVFYELSPRFIEAGLANKIIRSLPPFVTSVGLFVDPDSAQVQKVINKTSLDCLQFHGDEQPGFCGSFGLPYLKAIRMRESVDLVKEVSRYQDAVGILLDSFSDEAAGGTGQSFDWARIPADLPKPVVLAGGLNPDNVKDAIRTARPYAVDVSSGVEESKGIKDKDKIEQFVKAVASCQ